MRVERRLDSVVNGNYQHLELIRFVMFSTAAMFDVRRVKSCGVA